MWYIHISENCLKYSRFYSMDHMFRICMTMDLANQTEPYCPRWPPPMVVPGVGNQRL